MPVVAAIRPEWPPILRAFREQMTAEMISSSEAIRPSGYCGGWKIWTFRIPITLLSQAQRVDLCPSSTINTSPILTFLPELFRQSMAMPLRGCSICRCEKGMMSNMSSADSWAFSERSCLQKDRLARKINQAFWSVTGTAPCNYLKA